VGTATENDSTLGTTGGAAPPPIVATGMPNDRRSSCTRSGSPTAFAVFPLGLEALHALVVACGAIPARGPPMPIIIKNCTYDNSIYVSLAQVSRIPRRRRAAPGRTGRAPFPSKSCALEVGSVHSNRTVMVHPPGSDPIGVTPFRNGPCRNLFKRSIPGTNDGQQRARTSSGSAVPSPPSCPGNPRGSGDR